MYGQGVRCPYCFQIFLDHQNLSYHFVKYHFFIITNTACPICNIKCLDVLKHVHQIHDDYCLYCLKLDPSYMHHACADYITQATNTYFGGNEISINSPGKK